MNFIQQAFKGHYEWWRYLVGTLIIFIFWQIIGAIPFMGSIVFKLSKDGDFDQLQGLDTAGLMKVFDSNTTLFLMLLVPLLSMNSS